MKNDVVKHSGEVLQIEGNFLQVKIVQTAACSSCSIKTHCTTAESKEHLIRVYDKEALRYHVGDKVWVIGSTSMGRKAVWYGYLLPLLLLMALLIGFMSWFGKEHELSVALGSLVCIAVYYFLLYYFGKDKMKKAFNFSVQPMN
ncbi:MAG: SoxR reducing system RseC family protein [Bacteroidaceae bacterium]|nr:SoxR reducing system RseC family protein [Bacteroidaceae bacterium]